MLSILSDLPLTRKTEKNVYFSILHTKQANKQKFGATIIFPEDLGNTPFKRYQEYLRKKLYVNVQIIYG